MNEESKIEESPFELSDTEAEFKDKELLKKPRSF